MSRDRQLKRVLAALGMSGDRLTKTVQRASELRRKQEDGTLRAEMEARFRAMREEIAAHDPLERVRMIFEERWEKVGYDGLLPEEHDHLHIWWLNVEVNNGSFDQYLYNSTGDQAPETFEALGRIGAVKTQRMLGDVLALVGSPYPTDRAERWKRLEQCEARDENAWERRIRELSREYYECDEPLTDATTQLLVTANRREGVPLPPLPI
jgi:hypothetical protein